MDQDDYLEQLRLITHPELTGPPAETKATKTVAYMFVSLRRALLCALLPQAWLLVYVVPLLRVQEPTHLQIKRSNAIARKAIRDPKRIALPRMKPSGEIDTHGDSG